MTSRNTIIILGLVGAFILGTLSANPVVDALSPVIALLTDATFGLEAHQQSTLSPENLYLYLGDTVTTVDSVATVVLHTSIAIGTDGNPVISYRNNIPNELKVAHCIDVACTSAATITIVDSGGKVGTHTSIAIGTDDFPVISYGDADPRDLKVAHCIDIACTSAAIITVDSSDDVGTFTSIAIGADGLPVISYLDSTNDDLKVAHCNDTACTNFGTTTVDTGVDVGFSTSIAIGADGLPVISHLDTLNDDLKVVHCNDPLCSPVL